MIAAANSGSGPRAGARRHPRPLFVTSPVSAGMVAVVLSACADATALPTPADVPVIMAEASGETPVTRRESPARRAVRLSFRVMLDLDSIHESGVRYRFSTPHLRSYLFLDESYIGGDFPREMAGHLRHVHVLNRDYLDAQPQYPDVLSDLLDSADLQDEERRALVDGMAKEYASRRRPFIGAVRAFDDYMVAAARVYELAAQYPASFTAAREGLLIDNDAILGRFNRLADEANAARAAADRAIDGLDGDDKMRFVRMRAADIKRAP